MQGPAQGGTKVARGAQSAVHRGGGQGLLEGLQAVDAAQAATRAPSELAAPVLEAIEGAGRDVQVHADADLGGLDAHIAQLVHALQQAL